MEYTLYKGDKLLSIGTVYQIANEMGIKLSTVLFYKSEAYKERLKTRNAKNARVLVAIEPDEAEATKAEVIEGDLEDCKRELELINRELANDVVNENSVKILNLKLNSIGYKLYPMSAYFTIVRIGYTSPDLRKGLN